MQTCIKRRRSSQAILFIFCILTFSFKLETWNCFSQNSRLWATYYGGAGGDWSGNVTTDALGNVYLAGNTGSFTGIASGGFQNTIGAGGGDFLVKFDAAGNRLWATYYGGFGFSSVVTDALGNVYLAGSTGTSSGISFGGFQNIYGGSTDAFLVKFDANGTRLWATYYGGAKSDNGCSVATDASGNVYLAGTTSSTVSIASGGFQNIYAGGGDAFLVKFDANGDRLWATYYGGLSNDYGHSLATDASGNVYLAGVTSSTSGIASGGFQNIFGGIYDDFLVKFDPLGDRLWGTYYGGTDNEFFYTTLIGINVATDVSGNVYIVGTTTSSSGIASGGFQNFIRGLDNFLVKFDALGNRLWATYYGGSLQEEGGYIATDACDNVYVTGDTYSMDFIASGGFQNGLLGGENQYVVKFDSFGNRICATYYGQAHDEDGRIAVDRLGNIYLAGSSDSEGMAAGGFQNSGGGFSDAYLVKFGGVLTVTATSISASCKESCNGMATAITLEVALCPGTYSYSWNTIPVQTTQTATGLCEGIYTVTVTDALGATTTATVSITAPAVLTGSITSNDLICNGDTNGNANISANGGTTPYTYLWSNSQTDPTIINLVAGTYTVIITDINGCTTSATVTITPPAALVVITSAANPLCNAGVGSATVNITGATLSPYNYLWDNGQSTATATGLTEGTYTVTVTDASGCSTAASVTIVSPIAISLNTTSNPTACVGQTGIATVTVSSGGSEPYFYSWNTNPNQTTQIITGLGPGTYIVTITDVNGCTQIQTVTIITTTIEPTAIAMTAITKIASGDSTQLNAGGGVYYQWIPAAGLSCVTCANPIAKPTVTTSYCVEVVDENGCANSACLTIDVEKLCGEIFVPTAFSPDNIRENDMECVYGKCIESMSFVIFNRWGEKVFETHDLNECWDGKYNGKKINGDVFVYYLNAILQDKQILIKKGNVTLIE